jgi:hypothetical protein
MMSLGTSIFNERPDRDIVVDGTRLRSIHGCLAVFVRSVQEYIVYRFERGPELKNVVPHEFPIEKGRVLRIGGAMSLQNISADIFCHDSILDDIVAMANSRISEPRP